MYNQVIPVDAGADLRELQWNPVQVDGTIASSPANAVGIISNRADNGDDVGAIYAGRSKFNAAEAIAAGAQISCAGSGFTTATSGDQVIGRNIGDAVSSGAIGADGIFNFAGGGTIL